MAVQTYTNIDFTSSGGTLNVAVGQVDNVILIPDTSPITMANNVDINFSGTASEGDAVLVGWGAGIDINGNTFTINGISMSANQMLKEGSIRFLYSNGAWGDTYSPDLRLSSVLSGTVLIAGTVGINKLESGTPAQIVVLNSGGVPAYVGMTGDIGISDTGATSIGAGVIVNADINAAAAIARTKLASGTASQVLTNDGSGVMSSEAQLATLRGGTGLDTSGSSGFPVISAGAWSVGAITQTLRLDVSFEVGWQGTYYMTVPFPCTVTAAKARVTKDLSGTDAGTIQLQDNSETNFTGGLITIPLGSVHGTGVTATAITANNVFTAGQEIRFLVDKPTDGGACSIDVTITRLTLS